MCFFQVLYVYPLSVICFIAVCKQPLCCEHLQRYCSHDLIVTYIVDLFWASLFVVICFHHLLCMYTAFTKKSCVKQRFLAQDVIYTSCAYATMPVSICLSVCLWCLCIVVTGCNGSRIPLHAWIDGCLCYLLTMPCLDCWMGWCLDFWWKRGVWKNW